MRASRRHLRRRRRRRRRHLLFLPRDARSIPGGGGGHSPLHENKVPMTNATLATGRGPRVRRPTGLPSGLQHGVHSSSLSGVEGPLPLRRRCKPGERAHLCGGDGGSRCSPSLDVNGGCGTPSNGAEYPYAGSTTPREGGGSGICKLQSGSLSRRALIANGGEQGRGEGERDRGETRRDDGDGGTMVEHAVRWGATSGNRRGRQWQRGEPRPRCLTRRFLL